MLSLHERLIEGDRTASEEVAVMLLSQLTKEVTHKFPHTDEQIVSDGVVDAILDYCSKPQMFDPNFKVPLDRFLRHAATQNVLNLIQSEKRRKIREGKYGMRQLDDAVELGVEARNILQEEIQARMQGIAKELEVLDNPVDRKIRELVVQGERRTEVFAKVLGIAQLPTEEQRREVKRAKDRIDKKISRHKGVK